MNKFKALANGLAKRHEREIERAEFSTLDYWEHRYRNGGNSGQGSRGKLAKFKAHVINEFVKSRNIKHVIELGCGDGHQLSLASYHSYLGLDISAKAIDMCRERFRNDSSKAFKTLDMHAGETGDLSLSLDVIFHLIEESSFNNHMIKLFESSTGYACIYSSNTNDNSGTISRHVKHRCFTNWINHNAKDWTLIKQVKNPFPYKKDLGNGSFSNFYFYAKKSLDAQDAY